MRQLPANSVDSLVCDPPYGISFMGKAWDTFASGDAYRRWCRRWAREALRLLKPGGYALVFSGTRMYHWMAVGLEQAGFVCRDMIEWVYGCYSEDTECLTKRGWLKYTQLKGGDEVLQWDPQTNQLTWYAINGVLIQPAPKTMVSLQNRHSDQLLTADHTTYLTFSGKRSEGFKAVRAGDIKQCWAKDFPVAGELDGGISVPNAYAVGWWLTDAWPHKDGKACMFSQSKPKTLKQLRFLLDSENCAYSEYTRKACSENHADEHVFYVTGPLAEYLRQNYPNRKLTWDVLTWNWHARHDLLEGLLDGDGSRAETQHAETFWSQNEERLNIVQALCVSLNIRSHIDSKKGCVYLNRKTNTTQLQAKHPIRAVKHRGKVVWCLKTETGAFVVRRNGRPFISGNSGFPKSHNVAKAIDARLKTGNSDSQALKHTTKLRPGAGKRRKSRNDGIMGAETETLVNHNLITEEAKQWEGYGTALKPAQEPIGVFQKPLSERTIAANVLQHGTGGLNIDECRTNTTDKATAGAAKLWSHYRDGKLDKNNSEKVDKQGRWPANFVHDGSPEVVSLFPNAGGGDNRQPQFGKRGVGFINVGSGNSDGQPRGMLYSDTGSAARFFYCAKPSRAEREIGLAHWRASSQEFWQTANGTSGQASSIAASRKARVARANNHPTVKPVRLMRWLVRLVTPQSGIVLDPFMGSGTTGVAARCEDLNFLGIERSRRYHRMALARCRGYKQVK